MMFLVKVTMHRVTNLGRNADVEYVLVQVPGEVPVNIGNGTNLYQGPDEGQKCKSYEQAWEVAKQGARAKLATTLRCYDNVVMENMSVHPFQS